MDPSTNPADVPGFQIARWADVSEEGQLHVEPGARPIQMSHSDGTGLPLVKLEAFGADVIRFAPGKGIMKHTHMGDSIIFVISGTGHVEYDGVQHDLAPGLSCLIPSMVNHAIQAATELVIIVVGNNHMALDSKDVLQQNT